MRARRPGGPPSRVVLLGFMASGKSTVGRRLARLLHWDFVDFDAEIERRTGLTIAEIFQQFGEAGFRALEAELTAELAGSQQVVLAPGGGWITQPDLLERLAPHSLVLWLRISPEEALRRARRAATHRPLLAGPQPLRRARALLARREPLYRLADWTIDVDGRRPDQIAREIAARIRAAGEADAG
ncbi:MAG: shikimate kinase [Gemmatimonadetes bacterium]|nr:shikimate kinase [Gemmatimonadota bacterium]